VKNPSAIVLANILNHGPLSALEKPILQNEDKTDGGIIPGVSLPASLQEVPAKSVKPWMSPWIPLNGTIMQVR